jgi:hypothetical protein
VTWRRRGEEGGGDGGGGAGGGGGGGAGSPVWASHPVYVMWPYPSHIKPEGEGNMFFQNTGIHLPHYVNVTTHNITVQDADIFTLNCFEILNLHTVYQSLEPLDTLQRHF